MTAITADFETGTNGSNVLTTDTGSQTAWDFAPDLKLTYNNATVAHGSLSAQVPNSTKADAGWTTSLGTPSSDFGRIYVYVPATAISGSHVVDVARYLNSGRTQTNMAIFVDVGGILKFQNHTGTSKAFSTTVTGDTWIRVEWSVTFATSGSGGTATVNFYASADSSTLTETQTLTGDYTDGTNSFAGAFWVGSFATRGTNWFVDQVVAKASALPGAFPVNSVAPTVSGSASVGSTLTASTGTWNGTFNYTYQWTRDGSNIAAATGSTYVTQSADIGHAVGCKVTATGQQATNENATQASSNTVTPAAASSGSSGADPSKTAVAVTLLGL